MSKPEDKNCFLVISETDYEGFVVLKGFGCEVAANAFISELEAYERTKPEWPARDASDAEHGRFNKDRKDWLNGHPGGEDASGGDRFRIKVVPFIPAMTRRKPKPVKIKSSPVIAGEAKVIGKETLILESKDSKGVELWISEWDGVFMLDSEFNRQGFKTYDELPRAYRTERGARQAAALLTSEKLKWGKP